jgi:O-antigen ligase
MEETEVRVGRRGLGDPDVTRVLLLGVAASSFFSIAVMQMLTGLAFLSWVVGLVRRGCAGVRGPLTLLMAAFVVASVISALVQDDPHGVRKALSGGMPLLVFWMTLNEFRRAPHGTRALKLVIGVALLAAVYGLFEGWGRADEYRVRGTLSHYMTYSGVVMMGACCAFAVALGTGRRGAGYALALVPLVAALLLTKTRGAWLGLSTGFIGAVSLVRARLLLLLPFLAVASYLLSPPGVQDRIRSFADLEDVTAHERVIMWGVGWRMIQDSPLLGVGPERSELRYDEFRPSDDPFQETKAPGHLHSNLVQIAAERGLLALALYLAIWIGWFRKLLNSVFCSDSDGDPRRTVLMASLAALTAFHVMGLFEYNFGDSEVVTLAMFLAGLGLSAASTPGPQEAPIEA